MAWKYRTDELSLKEFRKLSSTDREEYILLLLGIKKEELSTNDQYILDMYGPVQRTKKFLSLNED